MSTAPISRASPAGRSTPTDPLVIDTPVVRSVRLEHAFAGGAAEPITFLAEVELEGDVTLSPLRVTLAEPTRIAIVWPEPLVVRDAAGAERVTQLAPVARQQINDALVRHLLGDLGAMFS